MPKVSVIIAVYGAEKYIEKCARSLFEQTLNDIEYIFVDDCTPDKSMDILISVLSDYPNRNNQINIIHNLTNLGLGSTHTIGMKAATGDYLIYCDPDDWVEHNMYELLYNKAIEDNADIVVCDFFHNFNNQTIIEHYEPITHPITCINMSTKTKYWWTLWNRLMSRKFIDIYHLFSMQGLNYLEDLHLSIRCYSLANHISYIPVPLYHYRRNNECSILNSTTSRKKYTQRRICFDNLFSFIHQHNLDSQLASFINFQKEKTIQLLLDSKPINYKELKNCYPEMRRVILNNKSLKLFYRYSIWFAQKGVIFPLRIYISIGNLVRKLATV